MAENSKIQWTKHTWNPWIGCTKVSPACDDCYAEELMANRYGRVIWGAGEDRVRTGAENWRKPLAWDRAAAAAGRIDTVFCLSLGDIWDNEVDPLWRHQAFDVMRQTPNLIYLLLSKRIGNAVRMCDVLANGSSAHLPENAALGATVVNQDEWDRDIAKLRDAAEHLRALFTFVSVEPMLGRIRPGGWMPDWIICGGESGRSPRDMPWEWPRELMRYARPAGSSFFMKQASQARVRRGHGDPANWPEDLRMREFPPHLTADQRVVA